MLLLAEIDPYPGYSARLILAGIAALIAVTLVTYQSGVLGWILKIIGSILGFAVRTGFGFWRRYLSWTNSLGFMIVILGLITAGWWEADENPNLTILLGIVPMLMGMAACLAYIHLEQEHYEIERGNKALHNPLKGQEEAKDFARFGYKMDILLLVAAAIGMIGGFALFNQGLYKTIGASWYHTESRTETFADFLVYALLSLYRIVDLLDMANNHRLLNLAHVRAELWPAHVLVVAFRTFITLVLLEQVFAYIRKSKLLSETIADLFSPHPPIHQRARHALPHYGLVAIEPLIVSIRSTASISKDHRDALPQILADMGPSAIPFLLTHLHDPNEQIRIIAVAALGHLQAEETLPSLTPLIKDSSEVVRLSLIEALGNIASLGVNKLRNKHALNMAVRSARHARRWIWRKRNRTLPAIRDAAAVVIAQLRAALADPSQTVRTQAAKTIGALGAGAQSAAPDLLPLLQDEEECVRRQAAEALESIGAASAQTAEAMVPLLSDSSAAVRAAAASALGSFREEASIATTGLIELLNDRDETVRQKAAEALGKIGPLSAEATKNLEEGLASDDALIRAQTAEAIGEIGPAAKAVAPALAKILKDTNDRVRGKAVEALGKIGEEAAAYALPQLVRAMHDPDTWVQVLAAEALGEMGEAADEAIPALIRALKHDHVQVRYQAVQALSNLGATAEPARDALETACADVDEGVRSLALQALGKIGPLSPHSQVLIRNAFKDADQKVQIAAILACDSETGLEPATHQALLELIDDAHDEVRVKSFQMLARVAGATPELLAKLTQLVSDDANLWVKIQAAVTLGQLGQQAIAAGPVLVEIVLTQEADLREAALRALVQIQPPDATAAFIAGLKDTQADVRKIASAAWRKAASIPEEALPVLIEALRDPEILVRANAAFALSRLDVLPDEAIPFLTDCTNNSSNELRMQAALALKKAPPKVAQPIMERMLKDPIARVRLVAAAELLDVAPTHPGALAAVNDALSDPSPAISKTARELIEVFEQRGVHLDLSGSASISIPEPLQDHKLEKVTI